MTTPFQYYDDGLVQLDSDAIFVAQPELNLGEASAAARPVDHKGMCTTGAGDPFGVDFSHLRVD